MLDYYPNELFIDIEFSYLFNHKNKIFPRIPGINVAGAKLK